MKISRLIGVISCAVFGAFLGTATAQQTAPAPAAAPQESPELPAPSAPAAPAPPASQPPTSGSVAAPSAGDVAAAPPIKAEVIQERYPSGAVHVERQVIQDAKGDYINHGPWKAFYPDGKLIGGGDFVGGKLNGKWSRVFALGGGVLFASGLYDPKLAPFVSEAVFVEGALEGPWIITGSNQVVLSHWEFKQGKQHGSWIWFYPNGQKRREATYLGGEIAGDAINYAADGSVANKETYVDGRLKTLKAGYYGPGLKSWEGWYLLARPIVRTNYNWWEGDASTVIIGSEGRDQRHGLWTWWHPNGQKQTEGKYVLDAAEGHWLWWHPNGQTWIEGDYVLGKKSGPWSWWHPNGVLQRSQAFAVIAPPAAAAVVEGQAAAPGANEANAPAATVPPPAAVPAPAAIPAPTTAPAPTAVPAPSPAPVSKG
jgi:antitoxin component YwqK of YwqJK toxin-antitoxin module